MTNEKTTGPVDTRIVLRDGPLDGKEFRSAKDPADLPDVIHLVVMPGLGALVDEGRETVAYERAWEPIGTWAGGVPVRFALFVDDQGRHVYRPVPEVLEDALVAQP